MSALPQLRNELRNLLSNLPAERPLERKALDALVLDMVKRTNSADKHTEWECVCRREMLLTTARESEALRGDSSAYYQTIMDRLDVVLTLSELNACDQTLPLAILEDVFETQTVATCMKVFSWLETRKDRATNDMQPAKGKGPNLLRTLNNLIRRVSKTGSTAQFCGRILIFLSSVFPFGERSGVNLRGEYGPAWTPVSVAVPESDEMEGVEKTTTSATEDTKDISGLGESLAEGSSSGQSTSTAEEKKKVELYNSFWSLQTYFARPQTFANPDAMPTFKVAAQNVLAVLSEASKKEQAMMGTVKGPVKRNVAKSPTEETISASAAPPSADYFFAKLLTSPDLLEFELADVVFRRQILVQILILLRHLNNFTVKAKTTWVTTRNVGLQMDFTLVDTDEKWVLEFYAQAMGELRRTGLDGKRFADTMSTIFERERNWVRWKNDVCPPMDKTARAAREQREEAKKKGKKDEDFLREDAEAWGTAFQRLVPTTEHNDGGFTPSAFGSQDLDDVWFKGIRDLEDLESPGEPAKLETLHRQIQDIDKRMRAAKGLPPSSLSLTADSGAKISRPSTPMMLPSNGTSVANGKDQHARVKDEEIAARADTPDPAAPTSAASARVPAGSTPVGPRGYTAPTLAPFEITPAEEKPQLVGLDNRKQCLTWLALRLASRQGYLHHFDRVKGGNIDLLMQEIKKPAPVPGVAAGAQPTQTNGADPRGSQDLVVEDASSSQPDIAMDEADGVAPTVDVKMAVD
ncbi:UDP-glucose-4-epimerase [Tulasnella sp. 330]|nr:UDP-glucose-4-epimerase [Tulasnella sp. 330]KAG8884421.1 UDP-glucose-4-epimerase [Tulasnella sp. 332]